ncbi:MAG TPA: hypothetical protein VIK52_08185, partial [Opitutaceae bacterium]
MNPRHAVIRLAAILMLAAAHCELPAQATQTDYEAKLKEARDHAAQESWALARDAYEAALPLAPDAEAARWTKLWLADAAWQAEDAPSGGHASLRWAVRHYEIIDALVAGYDENTSRDDYWIAAIRSRIALSEKADRLPDSREWLLELADVLAAMPHEPKNIDDYLGLLLAGREISESASHNSKWSERWHLHLGRAVELARNAEEKALFLVLATTHWRLFRAEGIERMAARWDEAAAVVKGTSIEPLTDGLRFLFCTQSGYDPTVTVETPADIP